jgi:phosphohistidine swiveling domain-containing protein
VIDDQLSTAERYDPHDEWDPLHNPSDPHSAWTTTNVGEAAPGVQTPLSWSVWSYAINAGVLEGGYRIGALTKAERVVAAHPKDRNLRLFYGRAACQASVFSRFGDRLPGTSGPEAVSSIFGRVPPDLEFHPTKRRCPVVAVKLPLALLRVPGEVRAFTRDQDTWWSHSIDRVDDLDPSQTLELFREAWRRFDQAVILQSVGFVSVIQPLTAALTQTVDKAGTGDISQLSGAPGGAEMAVVRDIWRASRGQIDVGEVSRRHGFHGPMEGELSSAVWREDNSPLRRMIAQYATRDDTHDPEHRDVERRRTRHLIEQEVLDATRATRRPAVRVLLRLVRDQLPLRGVAKRSFLQGFDVLRASARRAGYHLANDRILANPDDVFYLTTDELLGTPPDDAAELANRRRERRQAYQTLTLPTAWTGIPSAISLTSEDTVATTDSVAGIGVSAGIIEGIVRVVLGPDFDEIEPDEVLVAPVTDPSWASIMFISSALVVDIGGALSHAAVIAREMGIPCVVNTQNGTTALHTGDRVRVDVNTGTVQVLERFESPRTAADHPASFNASSVADNV